MLKFIILKNLRVFTLAALAMSAALLEAQDYLQSWDVPDIAANPLVTGGNVFGTDVTDRRIKDRELVITIDDTQDGNPSNSFIAGYFQEFDPANCSAVRDFSGKTLSVTVYQTPVITNMGSFLNPAPTSSHFVFEIAFDTDNDGVFSSEDKRFSTSLDDSQFILPGTAGATFTIELNPANFPFSTASASDFDLTKVTRIGFAVLQDVSEEGPNGSISATFPNTAPNGYAWKFDDLQVCDDSAIDGDVLFHDDFSGSSLDRCKWDVGTNTIGRTQLGQSPDLAAGIATLKFNTYNSANAGNTFLGTEIKTICKFNRGTGLEFEADIRVPEPIANGLVVAFFSFGFDDNTDLTDEIDFELLTNWINNPSTSERVLIASLDDFDENNPLPAQKFTANVDVNNLDTATFNNFKVRLFSDRTEWYVNDQLVREDSTVIPDAPMNIRLNLWAPAAGFADAFDASLQPAATFPGNNYFFEVDSMTVRRITDPANPTIPTLPEWGIIILSSVLVFIAISRLQREGFSSVS